MGIVTELEAARADMILAGMTLGLSDPVTVKLSQAVDRLLNQMMQTVICPECGADMDEIGPDQHRCPECGEEIEQIKFTAKAEEDKRYE